MSASAIGSVSSFNVGYHFAQDIGAGAVEVMAQSRTNLCGAVASFDPDRQAAVPIFLSVQGAGRKDMAMLVGLAFLGMQNTREKP
jgi:hypothetical protein